MRSLKAIASAAALLLAMPMAHADMALNGGFETTSYTCGDFTDADQDSVLYFQDDARNDNGNEGVALDNIAVASAVPELSPYAMLLLGCCLIGLAARRNDLRRDAPFSAPDQSAD